MLFPERKAWYYDLNDSTSLSAVLPWKSSSKHQQWEPENLVLRAFGKLNTKDGIACGYPLIQRGVGVVGCHSEILSPYLMTSTSLLFNMDLSTFCTRAPFSGFWPTSYDQDTGRRSYVLSFCILFAQVSVSRVVLSLESTSYLEPIFWFCSVFFFFLKY